MSSFDVEVLPEAEAEARAAFRWYFDRSPMAADAFRVELFDAIDGLTATANDWPDDDDGTSDTSHTPCCMRFLARK